MVKKAAWDICSLLTLNKNQPKTQDTELHIKIVEVHVVVIHGVTFSPAVALVFIDTEGEADEHHAAGAAAFGVKREVVAVVVHFEPLGVKNVAQPQGNGAVIVEHVSPDREISGIHFLHLALDHDKR